MVYTSSKACIYIKVNMVWYIWYKSKSPKNQLERATNPKFHPQVHKCSLVEMLGKDVCKLILGRDMTQHNGTGAITKKWDLGALLTKVSQSVWNPQQLGTTTRGCNILCLDGRLSYTRLLAGRPRNQPGPKKLTRTRSRLPLDSATREIRIRKTMKRKSWGGRIPKAKTRGRL
jgi:hypothetical protein